MAETKTIITDWNESGLSPYATPERQSDGFLFDTNSGDYFNPTSVSFANSYFFTLTENAVLKGSYSGTESRQVWQDDIYNIPTYKPLNASSLCPSSDQIIGTGQMIIRDDLEVFLDYQASSLSNEVSSMAVNISSLESQVGSISTQITSLDVRVSSIGTEVNSNNTAISSLQISVNSLQVSVSSLAVTTTEIINQVDVEEGMPRIEAGDTWQFTKNWNTVPSSSQVNIFHRSTGTIVVSGVAATQSGTSANFYYFNTTNASSGYTTVNSSGIYVIEWLAFRSTGQDQDNQYFEVIKTNG